jgi:hypothetical protein
MSTLFHIFNSIQNTLFPWLEEALDPLSEKEQKFVQVVSLMDLQTRQYTSHLRLAARFSGSYSAITNEPGADHKSLRSDGFCLRCTTDP